MSFKANFELFLHVHEFANIDLPSQGIFRLRASVYQQQGQQKIYGTPFQFMEERQKPIANSKKIYHPQSVQPPYFYTKAGIIKYSDEKVIFDDQIRFKLEVESFPRFHSESIFIQFDLIFSEFCYPSPTIPQFKGSIVQTKKFRLESMQQGILSYCQGQFVGTHPSKFAFTIYTCLSNFKFGKYKLANEMAMVGKQDQQGKINVSTLNANQNVRIKELERSKVKTFDQFMGWVEKYYKSQVSNPLSYFYNTYTKNLRYYFYLAQQKLNQNSIIKHSKILKVPKQFLILPSPQNKKQQKETEVSQKQFRKYMINYEPKKLTSNEILQEINTIYTDIYMFLMVVEKQFQLEQLMKIKMKNQYGVYVKERYGQRVFRSTNRTKDLTIGTSSRQNKKIAKKMRQKESITSTVAYPIEDVSFVQGKQMMEFLFYEITNPKNRMDLKSQKKVQSKQKPQIKLSQKSFQNIFGKQVEQINDQNLNQKSQKQLQRLAQEVSGEKQPEQEQKQQDDSYLNVMHEKGSIDSELTQKSFQKQSHSSQNQDHIEGFEGVSDIEWKVKYEKTFPQTTISLPQLVYDEKNMLIVMCHGFQGSSYDMTILLRGLKQILPNASYLLARSNQGYTEGDIQQMGKRLHDEVQNYIRIYMQKENVILNFVGHSMGGIVARAGVKFLAKKYYNQFGFFCSLSSPHLGYLNGVDGMIKAGLWAILKFKPIKSLQQLKMEDDKDFKNTFIYKLASQGNLKRFRKIILFSSFEDSYVSWHSARISVYNSKNKKLTAIQQEMVSNILGNEPIHRIDVNFNVKTKNLDSFIGRTAHINLIIQQSLFKILNSTIPQLFDLRQ